MCIKPSVNAALGPVEDLNKDDAWLLTFDFEGFSREIRALGKKLEAEQGPADVAHLNKMIMWSNACAAVGLLTLGFGVNLVSIVGLSLYTFSRWAMIAHHTCHGGYEKCHPNLSRWSRFKFGLGSVWRRFYDWFDYMMPEAWNVEHNNVRRSLYRDFSRLTGGAQYHSPLSCAVPLCLYFRDITTT
jgi:hypothetical protein